MQVTGRILSGNLLTTLYYNALILSNDKVFLFVISELLLSQNLPLAPPWERPEELVCDELPPEELEELSFSFLIVL